MGGAGSHLCYPWGNGISEAYANVCASNQLKSTGFYNGNQIPFGPDTINSYGLYDVIGNIPEWTRTSYLIYDIKFIYGPMSYAASGVEYNIQSIEKYPHQDSLNDDINSISFAATNTGTSVANMGSYNEGIYYGGSGGTPDVFGQILLKSVRGVDSDKLCARHGGGICTTSKTIGLCYGSILLIGSSYSQVIAVDVVEFPIGFRVVRRRMVE